MKTGREFPSTPLDFVWLFVVLPFLTAVVLLLSGCTTIEHEDGRRETRFDAEAVGEVLDAGLGTWERVRAADRAFLRGDAPLEQGGFGGQNPGLAPGANFLRPAGARDDAAARYPDRPVYPPGAPFPIYPPPSFLP